MWNVSPDRAFKKIWNRRHFSENRRYQLGKPWRCESSRGYGGMPISWKYFKLSDVLLFKVGVVRLCWQWQVTFLFSVDSDVSHFAVSVFVFCLQWCVIFLYWYSVDSDVWLCCQCFCILLTVTCHFFVFCWQWCVTFCCQCFCILLTVMCHFFVFCWQWRVGGPDGEVPVHLPVPPPWPADQDLRWGQTQWLPPVAGTSKSSQYVLILKHPSLPKACLC